MRRLALALFALCLGTLTLCAQEINYDSLDISYHTAERAVKSKNWGAVHPQYALWMRHWKGGNLAHTKGQHAQMLDWERQALLHDGQKERAEAMLPEIIQLQRDDQKVPRAMLAVSLANMATVAASRDNWPDAVKFQEEAVKLLIETRGPKHEATGVAQSTLAAYIYNLGDDDNLARCIQLTENALKGVSKNDARQADALNSLVLYYSRSGNDAKANAMAKKALKKGQKAYGANSARWAAILTNHSVRFARTGNYTRATEYAEQALPIYQALQEQEKLAHNDSIAYAKCLSNLASYLTRSEQFDRAIDLYKQAIGIYTLLQGANGVDCVRCTTEMAAIYTRKGDIEKGEELDRNAQAMIDAGTGQKTDDRARVLLNRAETAALAGNYDQAIATAKECITLYDESRNTSMAASVRNILSGYYYRKGNYTDARQWCSEALQRYEAMGRESQGYALALNNMSMYYYADSAYTDALTCATRASDMFVSMGTQTNSNYAKVLNNLSLYYYAIDSVSQAIEKLEEACRVQETALGAQHPDNVLLYYNMANYYYSMQRPEETCQYYTRALDMQMDFVRSNFAYLTSSEREMYWNKKSYVLRLAPSLAYMSNQSEALSIGAYDALLFTKGLLLNSEIDFKKLLYRSNNKALLEKYNKLEELGRQIDDNLKSPDAESRNSVASLRNKAAKLEKELVKECKEFGSFTQNLSIRTADVAKALGPDDVAVEFVNVRLVGGDYGYAALVLRHDWDAPRMVKCFAISDLNQRRYVNDTKNLQQALLIPQGVDEVFNDSIVGQMIWNKLIAAWGDGVKTVYFSPAGALYQMGIEYLKYKEDKRICDDYVMYRVSSTKSVCLPEDPIALRSAAIFGGIDYDLDISYMQSDHRKLDTGELTTLYAMNDTGVRALEIGEGLALDSLLTRGVTADFLGGALKEAENIQGMFLQNDIVADRYPDEITGNGTEEAFKRLSGKGQSIIHIATHGFYFTERDIVNANLGFMKIDDDAATDNSMNYSGLLLAGANNALSGKKLPAGIDNGILTAKEISLLDFRDLDLVVLSACNTGRGEVKDDGVFGLQRGFKKAGARTLLMSLWSVSDAATEVMMTSFYEALLSGTPKHDAFTAAQRAVRQAGYTSPYYWASFIMLDAK